MKTESQLQQEVTAELSARDTAGVRNVIDTINLVD
jgi:hypothetical protein